MEYQIHRYLQTRFFLARRLVSSPAHIVGREVAAVESVFAKVEQPLAVGVIAWASSFADDIEELVADIVASIAVGDLADKSNIDCPRNNIGQKFRKLKIYNYCKFRNIV